MSNQSFRPADIDDFRERYPQFRPIIDSTEGTATWKRLNVGDSFQKMRWATLDLELPAVAGIAKMVSSTIAALRPTERDHFKKAVGAMVCVIMERNGFKKTGRKKAVPPVPHRVFRVAEVYEPRAA